MRSTTVLLIHDVVNQPPMASPPTTLALSSDSDSYSLSDIAVVFLMAILLMFLYYIISHIIEKSRRNTSNASQRGRRAAPQSLRREPPASSRRAMPEGRRVATPTGVRRPTLQVPRLLSLTSVKEIFVTYSDGEKAEECAICLDEFKVGEICWQLSCNHKYHQMCIDNWLLRGGQCPLCRDSVQGSAPPNTTDTQIRTFYIAIPSIPVNYRTNS